MCDMPKIGCVQHDCDECATREQDKIDAARYRWLRERDLDMISKGGVFAGMTPQNVVMNGEDLDQAIDEAMRAEGAPQ